MSKKLMLLPPRIISITLTKDGGRAMATRGKRNTAVFELWEEYLGSTSDIIDIKKEEQGRQLGDANDTTTV